MPAAAACPSGTATRAWKTSGAATPPPRSSASWPISTACSPNPPPAPPKACCPISTGPKCPSTTSGWKKGCLRDRAKSYFWKTTQTPERPETDAFLFGSFTGAARQFLALSVTGCLRTLCQLPRTRGSQNVTFRLLPPTRAGQVPPQAAERARTEREAKMHGINIQNFPLLRPKSTSTPPARTGPKRQEVKKRKQKPKICKSGLDTGGGYAIMLLKGKGPSFQPVLGLYLLY